MGTKRYISLLLLSLLLFIGGAQAKSPPPGSGSADVPANILLMLDTSGSMSTLLDGPNSRYPSDVAFDSLGNIYVAKYYDEIVKYDSSGNYLLSWGSTGTSNGKFDLIYSIAIDASDNIYVSDNGNSRVQKFNTNGTYVSKFSVAGGAAYGLDVDSSGNVYVANGNGDVEKHSSTGSLTSTWNTSNSRWVAVDNTNSLVYVTRNSSKKIEKYNLTGSLQSTINLSWKPLGIEVDSSGNLYVSDNNNDKIYKLSSAGAQLQTWGSTGSTLGKFNAPRGVEIRPSNGLVYVADFNNHRVQSNTGVLLIASVQKTRLEAMQTVIKNILSDSNLTNGANFGLLTWNSAGSGQMRVNISSTGASSIYNMIDTLSPGGSTYLASAMSVAQNYFLGASSPMISSAACSRIFL